MKRLPKIIRFLFVLGFLGGIFLFLSSDFWAVKKINCQMESTPCGAELWTSLMAKSVGKSLFRLKTASLSQEILQENPLLQAVKIRKSWPNQLVFSLRERKAEARLGIGDGDKQFFIDEEGMILAEISDPNNHHLPLLLVDNLDYLKVGQKVNQKITVTLAIFRGLRLNLFEPITAQVEGQKITLALKDIPEVIFSAEKGIDNQIDSLQLIFSRAKIEGRKLSRVDLRFDKPVANYD
jgi:cell division septal protein FtsQ